MKIVSANITGSLIVNGVDITTTVQSSSIWSGSFSTRVTSLESFSSSLDATYATDAQLTSVSQSFSSSISILSGSLEQRITNTETTSSNLTIASGSFSTRVSNTEATASSLVNASSSFSTRVSTNETNISNLQTASGSFSTRVSSLETASGSFSTRVSTNETNISNLQNASSSFSTRVTSAESSITSIQDVTGSYATTGSNNFVGNQRISSTNNAIGFTSTASLYADGGLRVAKDAYISGTLYLNNLTVYGTQSVQYITASQLNISTNIISVNTDTPSIRYGGLSVYDSGSTGLTGSLLWDSEQNHWIYTNPSGSGYSGGMLISGPRASSLGAEQGTTCNALMKGQGGDHITSSGIFDYGTCTSFYGNSYINSSGLACFNDTVCANTFKSRNLIVCEGSSNATIASSNNEVLRIQGLCQAGMFMSYMSGSTVLGDVGNSNQAFSSGDTTGFGVNARGSRVLQLGTNQAFRVTIAGTGETTFTCQVCAPSFISTGTSCFNGCVNVFTGNQIRLYNSAKNNWVQIESPLVSGDAAIDFKLATQTGVVYMNNTGITCFNNTVCTPALVINKSNPVLYINAGNNEISTIGFTQGAVAGYGGFIKTSTGLGDRYMSFGLSAAGTNNDATEVVRIDDSGVTCFLGGVCAGGDITGKGAFNGYAGATQNLLVDWSAESQVTTLTNTNLFFGTNAQRRMTISSAGIACFACQVCAPLIDVQSARTDSLTLLKLGTNNASSANGDKVNIDFFSCGSLLNGRISRVIEDFTTYAGGLTFSTGITSLTDRLRITSTGIACFACQICTTTLSANTISLNAATANYAATITNVLDDAQGLLVRATDNDTSLYLLNLQSSNTATGQTWVDRLAVTKGGNVGISMASPSFRLDVMCYSVGQAVTVANFASCNYNCGCPTYIQLGAPYSGGDGSSRIGSISTTSNFSDIVFEPHTGTSGVWCERMRITSNGNVGIGTCAPNEKLTVWTPSTTGLQTALRLNNPFGFNNLNTGTQIVFSQDRSVAEDLKQGIIAVGQADAGTSATSYMAFYTNNTGLGERLRITSTGVSCFACQVCAPQYITTQGSSVSYADGSNYLVWSSEGEYSAVDNNTTCTLTTMKTWIADRTGCVRLKFAGYISSGPTYWGWRIYRNGTSAYTCQSYATCLETGCSANVHGYTTFSVGIGPVNPGDCITLQMVSTGGGSVPAPGQGQTLYAKEFRIYSTTPNFSAGSPSNIFGDRLGIGTCTPAAPLTIKASGATGILMACDSSNAGASSRLFFESCWNQFAILNNAGALSFNYNSSLINTSGTAGLRMSSNGVVFSTCQICTPMLLASGCVGIGVTSPNYTLHAGGRGYFFATNQDAGWGMLTLDYGNGTNSNIYAIQMAEGGAINAAIGFGSYGSPSNCGDLVMWTNDGGGLVERSRMYSNGAAKIASMGSNSTTVLQKSFSVGASGCVNVCFDMSTDIPGKGAGYVFQADIHVGGYGSAGASGLLYKASVAGYDGHYVGIGAYHKDAELVKCASGVDVKIYNPSSNPNLLGITIYNCSGTYVHVGTLRMVLTY